MDHSVALPWPSRKAASLTLFLLWLTALAQPSAAAGPPAPPPMPVNASIVGARDIADSIKVVGTLAANESVVMRPEISGRITGIHFEEGARTAAGDLLFSIEPAEFRARLKQTQAAAKLAELKFARARNLRSDQAISQQEFDEADSLLLAAQAMHEEAKAQVDKTSLRAPFDGVLGLRNVSVGAYVQPGQDLINLENIDPLKLNFNISERYAGALQPGQELVLKVDAYPGEKFTGQIHAINPRLDPDTRTFVIRGKVSNPDGRLKPGMFARIYLTLVQRKNSPVIPEQAIFPIGNELHVYKVVDGKAVNTLIEIGNRLTGEVEVLKGLVAGEQVITAGQPKVRDGSPVAVIP